MNCVCIIGGDFNCDLNVSSHASTMINDFLSSRNLYRCDLAMSYKVDYTFHDDSSNLTAIVILITSSHPTANSLLNLRSLTLGLSSLTIFLLL